MNVLTIAGNLGSDARLNTVQGQNGDVSVANFTVAVNRRNSDQPLWVDCALWGKRADALAQYLTKGTKVTVSGEAGIDSYSKNGETVPKLTLRVNEVTLQGGGQQGGQQSAPQESTQPSQDYEPDIPF